MCHQPHRAQDFIDFGTDAAHGASRLAWKSLFVVLTVRVLWRSSCSTCVVAKMSEHDIPYPETHTTVRGRPCPNDYTRLALPEHFLLLSLAHFLASACPLPTPSEVLSGPSHDPSSRL